MKTFLSRRLALAAAATGLLGNTVFAAKPPSPPPPAPSSGTLVLDHKFGGNGEENFGLTVAPSGIVYSSGTGYASDRSGWHGIVLASDNAGTNWTTMIDDSPPGVSITYSAGVVSDAAGNLYVGGVAFDETFAQSDHWVVRRSTDGGLTWTAADDFDMGGFSGAFDPPTGITADLAGNVYVCGVSAVAGKLSWTIRKGTGGTSFSTVDIFTMPNSRPEAIFAHPTAGIFTVGYGDIIIKGKASRAWVMRRSTDSGANWQTIDTFQLSSGKTAHANGIGADSLGGLYVVGHAFAPSPGGDASHWIARKSSNGGASFSTVDDFGTASSARRLIASPNGALYAAGVTTTSGVNHLILRKSPGGTGAWATVDDYQYPGINYIEPRSIAADGSSNVFVGSGSVQEGLWVVKKY